MQDFEQRVQGKVFNVQAQRSLSHLDPQSQDIVVLIDTGYQFADVLILAFLDFFLSQIIERSELVDFVHYPIYIRCNSCHQEQTSFLDQVLTLVFHQMLFVYILLLLQPAALIPQLNHRQTILQGPRKIRNNYFQQSFIVLFHIRSRLHLPIRHDPTFRILQREQHARRILHFFTRRIDVHIGCPHQIHQLFLDRCPDSLNYIFHLFGIRRNRSRDLPTNVQCIFQAIHIIGIPNPPAAVQEYHQYDQNNQSTDNHRQKKIQQISFFFQREIAAFQFLVLTGIVQDIQIDISVIVRLRLHSQSRISHTELFPETGNPFRHRHDSLRIDPFQFNGLICFRYIRLQAVQCIVTMIKLFMMKVDIGKCLRKVLQRLFMVAQLVIARSQGTVSSRYLIPISVLLEKLQRTLGKSNDQFLPRQILPVNRTHHSRTLIQKQLIILPLLQQFRHGLRSIGFKINIPFFMTSHQAIHQIVKLTHNDIFRRFGLIHATGTLHVVIIKKLRRIPLQFLFHIDFVNGFQGLRLLLQVIIIYRRSNGEFRASIIEPTKNSLIRHGLLVFTDTLHAP